MDAFANYTVTKMDRHDSNRSGGARASARIVRFLLMTFLWEPGAIVPIVAELFVRLHHRLVLGSPDEVVVVVNLAIELSGRSKEIRKLK